MDIGYVGVGDRSGIYRSRPFDHAITVGDLPRAIAFLQPVDIAPPGDPHAFVEIAGVEQVIGFGVGLIAVDFAAVVADAVLGQDLVALVQADHPIAEFLPGADEFAVIVLGIGVVAREDQLAVAPVDIGGKPSDAIVDTASAEVILAQSYAKEIGVTIRARRRRSNRNCTIAR